MVVAIHQPNFLPWLGFFYKMLKSEMFVFLDNVQFSKNSFQNRVKIKTPKGPMWLTVPVHQKFGQLTKDVRIDNQEDWRSKHLKTFETYYRKACYFDEIYPMLMDVYMKEKWEYLNDFNIELITKIREYLEIKTPIIKASSLNIEGKSSTDLLIEIVKRVGGTAYLSGKGGTKYMDESKFRDENIQLIYSDFVHPIYNQLWGEFIEGLSIVDLLFNMGPQGRTLLETAGRDPK
jgi:hypothetical protein